MTNRNTELSPDARALWFALKLHAMEPTDAESSIITFLMASGGSGCTDACELSSKSGIAVTEIVTALSSLAMNDVIRLWRDDSGKHRMSVNFDFVSPLFGGVC